MSSSASPCKSPDSRGSRAGVGWTCPWTVPDWPHTPPGVWTQLSRHPWPGSVRTSSGQRGKVREAP
eukprot:3047141-Amphidinium_carterae.1